MAKKEVEYTERNGEKFVAKKSSWIKKAKLTFLIFSVAWLALGAWYPLHVKNTYSEPIKKSIVVSMFFDLQQEIAGQYGKLLGGVSDAIGKLKDKIDFDKPIGAAVDKIKLAQSAGDSAKKQADDIKKQLAAINSSLTLAKKFGVKTDGIGSVTKKVDDLAGTVGSEVGKINGQLDGVKTTVLKAAKSETDKMFDNLNKSVDLEIRSQIDGATGGLSSVLLAKYNVKSVAPWRPSTWKISNQIYAELERSSKSTVQIIMSTINGYFGCIAWALVVAAWGIALLAWLGVKKKITAIIKPFIVCPNCGHAFSDRRTIMGILKVFQPWKWI